MKYIAFKRYLDFMASVVLLILLFPLFLLIGFAIKISSNGPIFFKQERLGFKGNVFDIYKFRSMIIDAEKKETGVYSFRGDPRVTKVGAFIRKTSLDELPQLFNIIKGDMSFIGPRPVLTYHPKSSYNAYTSEQKKRFEIRPGITGLAQVSGRKELPWDKRIVLDVEYINNLNFLLDAKIAFKTILKVFAMSENFSK